MKVVVGLGNPGRRFQNSRHNVGFQVVSELARRHGAAAQKVKFEAEVTEVVIGQEKTLLVVPQTYMNASGRSVQRCIRFFQLPLKNLLVVCDDLNLNFCQIRIRPSGSAGGQRGINDIIQHLDSQDFPRLRLGIGRPPEDMDSTNYVLAKFSSAEREFIDPAIKIAATAVETWICDGLDSAMNRFNAPPAECEENTD